jgi:hypothetical protein
MGFYMEIDGHIHISNKENFIMNFNWRDALFLAKRLKIPYCQFKFSQ